MSINLEEMERLTSATERTMTNTAATALEEISGALDALRTDQRQLDQDGVFVGVSRQALDEVLTHIAALEAELVTQRRVGVHEICSMCGLDLRKATTECPTWHGLDHLGCDYAKKAEAQLATRLPDRDVLAQEVCRAMKKNPFERDGYGDPSVPGGFREFEAWEEFIEIADSILALLSGAATAEQPEACPICHGDCAGANPPVMYCPMKSEAATAEQRQGWFCPNCGVVSGSEVTFQEYHQTCGAKVSWEPMHHAKSPPQGAEE